MKTNFAYFCEDKNEPLRMWFTTIPSYLTHRRRLTYDQFMKIAEKHSPPDSHLRELLAEQRRLFEQPPPPAMTKDEKEAIIRREIERYESEPDLELKDTRRDIEVNGYKGYIRRGYLGKHRNDGGPFIRPDDVEYHIHLDNYDECKLKTQCKKWGAFIYMNRKGYLCNGTYPSIQGTDYGVQYSKWF